MISDKARIHFIRNFIKLNRKELEELDYLKDFEYDAYDLKVNSIEELQEQLELLKAYYIELQPNSYTFFRDDLESEGEITLIQNKLKQLEVQEQMIQSLEETNNNTNEVNLIMTTNNTFDFNSFFSAFTSLTRSESEREANTKLSNIMNYILTPHFRKLLIALTILIASISIIVSGLVFVVTHPLITSALIMLVVFKQEITNVVIKLMKGEFELFDNLLDIWNDLLEYLDKDEEETSSVVNSLDSLDSPTSGWSSVET